MAVRTAWMTAQREQRESGREPAGGQGTYGDITEHRHIEGRQDGSRGQRGKAPGTQSRSWQ